ncbi:MAG: two-component sensor histidine kinase [Bacteroidales bacterium]|nr:two-component sensor histidine kinase [Bacteroidales bacterium]
MTLQRNKTFQNRIFFSFFAAFALLATAVLTFQYQREKEYRVKQLENTLDNITVIVHNYIDQNNLLETKNFNGINTLVDLLPSEDERITIIDSKGNVLFDSFVDNIASMENHLERPEIQKAFFSGVGKNIRKSATTNTEFYYYARYYNNYFVRTALVYDVQVKNYLHIAQTFIIFIIVLFALMWLIISIVTKKVSSFVTQLKDFSVKAAIGEEIQNEKTFSDNEFETISQQIKKIYNQLNGAKAALSKERDKLFQHLNVLHEGIAFFHPNRERFLTNSHFIHYVNIISEKSTVSAPNVLEIPELKTLVDFINQYQNEAFSSAPDLPSMCITVEKNEFVFDIKTIIFSDKSFEILITDTTRLEKRKQIKQQLTANIAHELKTPVASLKGYLETLLTMKEIPAEKRQYFTERAFAQAERLTSLLNDISLLNSIEEGGTFHEMKEVNISRVVSEVIENQELRLNEKNIHCEVEISENITVTGNEALLSSVFLNLVENTIRYAGEDLTITIRNYHSDSKYHYFSYSDNGAGIGEEHLSRIFERFYRTDEGRSRQTGGTGLGLSIVKNAITLHKGEISARNKAGGGLEFLFSLGRAW